MARRPAEGQEPPVQAAWPSSHGSTTVVRPPSATDRTPSLINEGSLPARLDPSSFEHSSAQWYPIACGGGCRDDGASARAMDDHAEALARNLPETVLYATSRSPTSRSTTAPLTCAVVWAREVLHGVTNRRRIDGKDGLSGTPSCRNACHHEVSESTARGSQSCRCAASVLPAIRQKPCLVTPHAAPRRLGSTGVLTWTDVARSREPQRCAWGLRCVHTAEAPIEIQSGTSIGRREFLVALPSSLRPNER
jgi:hypothetical protein